GHGLGVVAVGPACGDAVLALCSLSGEAASTLRERFCLIGERWQSMTNATIEQNARRAQVRALEEAVVQKEARVRALEEAVVQKEVRVRALEEGVVQKEARVGALEEAVVQKEVRVHALEEAVVQKEARVRALEEAVRETKGSY